MLGDDTVRLCEVPPRYRYCAGDAPVHARDEGDAVAVRLGNCHLRVALRNEGWRVIDQAPA